MRPIQLLSVWGYGWNMVEKASMNQDVREYRCCIWPIGVFACMDESVCMGMCGFSVPFSQVTNVHTSFSLPLSLSLYPCSTRKQNYMMNFARQTGVRHYYSRKRRALRQHAWTHREGIRPLTCQSHIDSPHTSFFSWRHIALSSPIHQWIPVSLRLPLPLSHYPLPETRAIQSVYASANQGLPNHMSRRERKEWSGHFVYFFPWTVGVSSCFLNVAVVPLISLHLAYSPPVTPPSSPHPPFPTTLWNWEIIYHCWTDQPIGVSSQLQLSRQGEDRSTAANQYARRERPRWWYWPLRGKTVTKKLKKKEKGKKRKLCSCCSVCLWVLFVMSWLWCSVHLFVRFLLIHMLLRGGGEGGAGFCFLFLVYLERMWEGREKPSTVKRNKRTICTMGKGENKKKLKTEQWFLFFFIIFYICWFPKIQIFMVNGSSRNLFKMHCAWNVCYFLVLSY